MGLTRDDIVALVALAVMVLFVVSFVLFAWLFNRAKRSRRVELAGLLAESEKVKLAIAEQLSEFHVVTSSATAQKMVDEKRGKFLSLPSISFHYADRERITNFYNDYFREPTIENIVSEMTTEVSGNIKGALPKVLESRIGGKDLSKWIRTIKLPDTSLNGMFLRYQRETITNNQVTLGLELLDVEKTELEEFDRVIEEVHAWGVHPAPEEVEIRRNNVKQAAAERTLTRLEQATGWVLIEGVFVISDSGDDLYRCTYQHPVTEYLSASHKTVSISVLIPKIAIEPAVRGNYQQSVGKIVPLRIYGEVWQPISRWQPENWDLTITPLAIY